MPVPSEPITIAAEPFRSAFQSEVDTEPDSHYVVLSTCAYSWEDARTALHGKLVPVDSAGGIPLA